MELLPILAALKHNKVGAILVSLQIALTLAVVANAMAIIQHHLADMRRPSGVDEANILTLHNHWVGPQDNLHADIEADLAALRSMSGIVDADATNSYPLRGGGWSQTIRLTPDQKSGGAARTALYFNDTHGLSALGLKLISGRWFTSTEISDMHRNDQWVAPSAVITAELARKLFRSANPVGRIIYMSGSNPTRVVGVVERAQTPWPSQSFGAEFSEYSTFLPFTYVNTEIDYLLRAKPGQLAAAVRAAPDRLYAVTRQRVVDRVRTFQETRARAYQVQQSESWLLAAVSGLLLIITGLGTIGLTAYWVGRRRRQIGMRRALGARRADILKYFHLENLIIAGTGALLGVGAGLGANLWMATHLGTVRMSPVYIGVGAGLVLILSQLAVLWPALRAASIQPSLATRGF